MPRISTLLAACSALALAAGPACATLYSFTLAPFTDAASLTVSFTGSDTNSDGLISGYVNMSGGGLPNEMTTLSLTFSGNSLVPAFTGSTTDFSSNASQTLDFPTGGSGAYALYYVTDAALADTTLGIPNLANGDALMELIGNVIDFGASTTTAIEVIGAGCGQFGGAIANMYQAPICALLGYQPLLPTAGTTTFDSVPLPAPEPATLALLGTALLGLAATRRRTCRPPGDANTFSR